MVWSHHVTTRCVVGALHFYSLAVGITAIRIDFARRRVVKSRALAIYATCMNVIFMGLIPVTLLLGLDFWSGMSSNNLLHMANSAFMCIYMLGSAMMMLFRRARDRRSEWLARQFFAIDLRYFAQLPRMEAIERRFERVLLQKACTTFGQCVASMFGLVSLTAALDPLTLVRAFYFCSLRYMLNGVIFQFYVELAHVRKRFEILNVQLGKLSAELQCAHAVLHANSGTLRQLQRLATAQLRRISQTHWQLAGLVQQLCRSYLLQMLTVLLSFAVYTIFFGYVGVLVADGTISYARTVASGVGFILFYINLLLDLYLFYRNCALTVAAHRRTADILRELHELPFASKELQRCSELFSLQLLERRLHISMAGMFVLNLQTLLALWAFILRHTIILVQSDWENRLRLQRANAQ